jgi:hypothetical protein
LLIIDDFDYNSKYHQMWKALVACQPTSIRGGYCNEYVGNVTVVIITNDIK